MALPDTKIPNNPATAQVGSPAAGNLPSMSPLGQMAEKRLPLPQATPNAPQANPLTPTESPDYKKMIEDQYGMLETARTEKQAAIDEATQKLLARQKGPSEAEMYFRLAGALGAPTKTGSFGETLAKTAEAGSGILKERREAQDQLEDLQMKYKMQKADITAETAKDKIGATKSLIGAAKSLKELNDPNSAYGKQAQDEGLKPGTKQFADRVRQLSVVDQNLKNAQANAALISAQAKENKPLNQTQQKALNTMLDASSLSERNVQELARLQGVVKSASWWQTGLAGKATAWSGIGKAAEIEAQISALAPKQRPPGAGATSDYDAKQYKIAVGGGLSKEGLMRTIAAGTAMHQNDAQYNTFMATVIENRGNQTEARKIWSEYAKQNPIFNEKGHAISNRTSFDAWVNGAPPAATGKPTKGGKEVAAKPAEAGKSKPQGVTRTIGGKNYYQHSDGSWHDEAE